MTRDVTKQPFTGAVHGVEIAIPGSAPDHDAEIPDEERLRAALIKE